MQRKIDELENLNGVNGLNLVGCEIEVRRKKNSVRVWKKNRQSSKVIRKLCYMLNICRTILSSRCFKNATSQILECLNLTKECLALLSHTHKLSSFSEVWIVLKPLRNVNEWVWKRKTNDNEHQSKVKKDEKDQYKKKWYGKIKTIESQI